MIGRLIFFEPFDDCNTGIKMGTYYPEFPVFSTQYKNVIYLREFEFQRASFERTEVEEVDNKGISRKVSSTTIERTSINLIANSVLLSYFDSIGQHSQIFLEVFNDPLDNTDTTLYRLDRVEMTDNTANKRMTGEITLTFDLKPMIETACCDQDLVILSNYLAYWDIDDDGTADIDANAPFIIGSLNGEFEAWQLYFESDGTTPLVSGDVELVVRGLDKNGATTVFGTFNGIFGDSLSDAAKWSSPYSVWNYFNLTNTIGHTNKVQFAKKDFAFDNGFVGGEDKDNAVKIELFLSVNNSPSEKVTLEEIYTILSSFGNQTSDELLNFVLQQQVNKVNEQPRLIDYAETRTDLATSIPAALTAFSLRFIDTFKRVYDISAVQGVESYSIINTECLSTLTATQRKGTNGQDDLSIGSRTDIATAHIEGIISNIAARQVTVYYWVQYQDTSSSFPIMGAPSSSGQWFFDGVNQGFLNTSLGYHSITLPTFGQNEDVRSVKFQTSTSGGTGPSQEVSIEFQVQLKRFY